MSRAIARPATAPGLETTIGRLAPDVVTTSADVITDFVQAMAALLAPATARPFGMTTRVRRTRTDCCAIPEVPCPPRCVCEVSWEAAHGETVRATIRLQNTSHVARGFAIAATDFVGAEILGGPKVAPSQLTLQPGEVGLVAITHDVGKEATVGRYEAEVTINGTYEQCVRIFLRIMSAERCPKGDGHCFCDVEQGDPPVRVRAHHWHDHFQCTEPCAPQRHVPLRQ